jgi:hypothetical protein
MFFGSKSAQTPSESSQQSKSNRDNAGAHVGGQLNALDATTQYKVIHKWRKVGSVAKRGMPHHSQVFVTTMADVEILNFGLFGDEDGDVVFGDDTDDPVNNPYHASSSYRPNPIVATGHDIEQAYIKVRRQCGPEYKLLHNNCQKFARLLMTALGASHHRELFHP